MPDKCDHYHKTYTALPGGGLLSVCNRCQYSETKNVNDPKTVPNSSPRSFRDFLGLSTLNVPPSIDPDIYEVTRRMQEEIGYRTDQSIAGLATATAGEDSTVLTASGIRRAVDSMAERMGDSYPSRLSSPTSGTTGIMLPRATVTEPEFTSNGPNMDEQKFIQRIGMQSNCNVSVQAKKLGVFGGGFNSGGLGKAYRLRCDHCQATQSVDDPKLIEHYKYADPVIADFCRNHQHLTGALPSGTVEGRKFRDA